VQKFVDYFMQPLVTKSNRGSVRAALRSESVFGFLCQYWPQLFSLFSHYA
jgi:hypothetical protein